MTQETIDLPLGCPQGGARIRREKSVPETSVISQQSGLIHSIRSVQQFRGGLAFKAHILCASPNSRLESNKKREDDSCNQSEAGSYVRPIHVCITHLKAQGFSRDCIEIMTGVPRSLETAPT